MYNMEMDQRTIDIFKVYRERNYCLGDGNYVRIDGLTATLIDLLIDLKVHVEADE